MRTVEFPFPFWDPLQRPLALLNGSEGRKVRLKVQQLNFCYGYDMTKIKKENKNEKKPFECFLAAHIAILCQLCGG